MGIGALLVFLVRKLGGATWGRSGRRLLATLTGLFDAQVVLGLIMLAGGRRPGGIGLHLAWMLVATSILHVTSVVQRRRAERAGFGVPLLGVALTLILAALGITAIGRGLV